MTLRADIEAILYRMGTGEYYPASEIFDAILPRITKEVTASYRRGLLDAAQMLDDYFSPGPDWTCAPANAIRARAKATE